jgi:hypothetical protein
MKKKQKAFHWLLVESMEASQTACRSVTFSHKIPSYVAKQQKTKTNNKF